LQQALNVQEENFTRSWQTMMAGKLGLHTFDPARDDELTTELLAVLQLVETDMAIFYRQLALIDTGRESLHASDEALMRPLMEAYYVPEQLTGEHAARIGNWLRSYIKRTQNDGTPDDLRRKRMNAINPTAV